MTVAVVILNGYPRAGKDTLIRFMEDVADQKGLATGSFSSIDPVRAMLSSVGIDTSRKTAEDRKLLAMSGSLLEEHCKFRSRSCLQFINQEIAQAANDGLGGGLYFLHIREPEIIEVVQERLHAKGVKVWRVYLESNRAEKPTNPVDAGVEKMAYDYRVTNNGTLGQLYDEASALVRLMLERPLPRDVNFPVSAAPYPTTYQQM